MKKLGIILVALVLVVFGLLAYSGLFATITIAEREMGPYTMLVKNHTGSYYKTGAVFDEVETLLKKKLDTAGMLGVGLYYDDPAKVEAEKLRSSCGYIVTTADLEKLGALPEGLVIKKFEAARCAVALFPRRSFLSYMIGPSRVYPKLAEYGKTRTFTGEYALEIYDQKGGTISYCMPVKVD